MKEKKEKSTCEKDIWHLRSVALEAINAANLAAKKEKKRTGKWVSEVILKAAQETLTKKTEVAKPEDVRDLLMDVVKHLQDSKDELRRVTVMLDEPWYKWVFRRKDK